MAAENPPRGAEEGEWVNSVDPEKWSTFTPRAGDIVEFETSMVLEDRDADSSGYGCMIALEVSVRVPHGLVIRGRFLGSENKDAGKALSTALNRRKLPLHLCAEVPCSYGEMEDAVHAVQARWWEAAGFETSYLQPWGKLVLKECLEGGPGEPGDAPPAKKPRREKGKGVRPRRAGTAAAPPGERPPTRAKAKARGEEPQDSDRAALQKKGSCPVVARARWARWARWARGSR